MLATRINGDNAVAWSLLAVYRSELKDDFGVDSAMLQAANAPTYEDYFGAQLRIMRDAMLPGSDFEGIELAIALWVEVICYFSITVIRFLIYVVTTILGATVCIRPVQILVSLCSRKQKAR